MGFLLILRARQAPYNEYHKKDTVLNIDSFTLDRRYEMLDAEREGSWVARRKEVDFGGERYLRVK